MSGKKKKYIEMLVLSRSPSFVDHYSLLCFSALTLLFEQQEGHLACKTLGVGLLMVMI